MKNQFLKRIKGIIALAIALLMFLQTGLTAKAEVWVNVDYTYSCRYFGWVSSGVIEDNVLFYNGQPYGFISASHTELPFGEYAFKTTAGSGNVGLFSYDQDVCGLKVIKGGETLKVNMYVNYFTSSGTYGKFVIKNGQNISEAVYDDIDSEENKSLMDLADGKDYDLYAALGESGHYYVWTGYDAGVVATENIFTDYLFYAAKSGSGTQTDPYIFGIELKEVYRATGGDSGDLYIARSNFDDYTCKYESAYYALPGDDMKVLLSGSGCVLNHPEFRVYSDLEKLESESNNPNDYKILSYSDVDYEEAEDGTNLVATFKMPEGHLYVANLDDCTVNFTNDKYKVAAKAATCTKTGNKEYYKCPSCEKIYAKEGDTFVEKTLQEVTIPAKGHNYKTVVEPATKNKAGVSYDQCVNCRDTKNKTTIYRPVVSLKKTAFTYNGKTQVPSVVVKDTKGKTISKSYYTVKYSNKNSKSIGTYKASVVLNTKYKGTIDLTYTIAPGKITLTKGDVTKNTIAVTWKKSSGATGYEVQYSTDKNFTKGKTKTATVKDKLTYKASKLTGNKTYYLRARSYTTVKNKKVYSDWSTTLKVKTSKK